MLFGLKLTGYSLVALFIAGLSWSVPRASEIMGKLDNSMALSQDVTCKVVIVTQRAEQGTKSYEALFYKRDRDDTFLIAFLAPESEKGNGYLRVGDQFFNYRQNTRTFQTVNRDANISGTGAKSGDFEKRKMSEQYRADTNAAGQEMVVEEKLGKRDVYKLTLVARVNDVAYPKTIYWVEKETYLPLKTQGFSLSGTLMETHYLPKWTVIDGKNIWVQLVIVDEFEKGNKSIIELSGISLKPIDDNVFTKAYLENLSK